MKRISAILLLLFCTVFILTPTVSVNAQSLDDIISDDNGTQSDSTTIYEDIESDNASSDNSVGVYGNSNVGNSEYLEEMKGATDLSEASAGATKLNNGIKKVASFIIQVLSYFATACLVIRVLLDVVYIILPFTRSFLSNGYAGNPQANGGGMQQPGMGGMGMGMGSMGMGGMGMGGYGSSRYGMGGMGMGSMGMGGMQQGMNQPGASPAMGRIQWVSTAALNAAAAEAVVGPNGKAVSPLKAYAKDMIVVLILTPIFLVLAITGALTDLGFLIGEMLANAISNIGGMI